MVSSNTLFNQYPKHTIVLGRVTRITETGVSLILSGGEAGYIPRREIAWGEEDQPGRFVKEGQEIEALVLNEDLMQHRLILSRRLALHNPWETIGHTYPVGSKQVGRVSHISEYGAFVELAPGVVGLAHVSEIPQQSNTTEPLELWPHDRVRAEILSSDPTNYKLSLSLTAPVRERDEQWQERRKAAEHGTPIGEIIGVHSDPLENVVSPRYDPAGPIRRILLVDDDLNFGAYTAAWLNDLDYDAQHVETIAAGKEELTSRPYDLLLVDYDLVHGTGLDLAAWARQQYPALQMVLLSAQADQQRCLRHQPVAALICWSKPFTGDDFADLLRELQTGICSICARKTELQSAAQVRVAQWESIQPTLASLDQLCAAQLRRLLADVGGEAGLVCRVEASSEQVRIVAQEGSVLIPSRADLRQFIFSPVKDVCVHGIHVRVKDVRQQQARFRYLLPLGNFRSFLGVPIPTNRRDLQLGFLLFHRGRGYFTDLHEQQAQIGAGFLALALERQEVLRITLAVQQTILAGRLSLSRAHEVQKQLASLGSEAEFVRNRLQDLGKQHGPFEYAKLLERGVPRAVNKLYNSIKDIKTILLKQLDFAHAYTMGEVDINDLVERVVKMMIPVARPDRIAVTRDLDGDLPRIYSAKLLIQQIFLNLAFNAVQQMAEAGRHEELRVITEYRPEAERPVRVLFSDCGPGIHNRDQERLFQFGFTTRTDGTGLGLYISRGAAEALGGRLYLAESYVGFGSTFALELPLRTEETAHG